MSFIPHLRLTQLAFVSVLTISLLLVSSQTNAQTTNKLFREKNTNKSFFKRYELVTHSNIRKTLDDAFIFAGGIQAGIFQAAEPGLSKVDKNGNILWQSRYSDPIFGTINGPVFNAVDATKDGGYVAVTSSFQSISPTDLRAYIVKVDGQGTIQWQKLYRPILGNIPVEFTGVRQTRDGGYIAIGSATIDDPTNFIVRFDAAGNLLWDRRYEVDSQSRTTLEYIDSTKDNGHIVVGTVRDGKSDIIAIKLNRSGNITWSKRYTNPVKHRDFLTNEIHQTKDGGYIVTGHVNDQLRVFGTRDGFVLKLKETGTKEWYVTLDNGNFDQLQSIVEAKNSNFVAVGSLGVVNQPADAEDLWLTQLDAQGNLLNKRRFKQTEREEGLAIVDTKDQGFLIAGRDKLFLKLDQNTKLLSCPGLSNVNTKIKDNDLNDGTNITKNLIDINGTVINGHRFKVDATAQTIEECPM